MLLLTLLLITLATAALAAGLARRVPPAAVAIGGVVTVAVLALIVHHDPRLGIDETVARWTGRHSTGLQRNVLDVVTRLGSTTVVVVLGLALWVTEVVRARRTRLLVPVFMVAAVGGAKLVNTGLKDLIDRPRPPFRAVAEFLGPAFPSGHSATAAVFYAAAAWVLAPATTTGPRVRGALIATAAGLTAAVAATRVLLQLHWPTDALAGVAVGWAWFALCVLVVRRCRRSSPPRRSGSRTRTASASGSGST